MTPATMAKVPMPVVPIDEDDAGSTGDAVGYLVVGDGVGGTVQVSNFEFIVPPRALFRSKVSVSLNPVVTPGSETVYMYCG